LGFSLKISPSPSRRGRSQYGLLHLPQRSGRPVPLKHQGSPHRRHSLISMPTVCTKSVHRDGHCETQAQRGGQHVIATAGRVCGQVKGSPDHPSATSRHLHAPAVRPESAVYGRDGASQLAIHPRPAGTRRGSQQSRATARADGESAGNPQAVSK